MLRWPVRSALYIDFENVPLSPDSIANWLAWLEDGAFESDGRRRRFLQKRVYWNSHAEKNRDVFVRHGFVPILIGKFSGLKNGADIRMAMDVIEATYRRPEIDEYILLTGDSDFVPVLERLREKDKRSAIVATEHRPNIHTTYHLHADVLIASRRLTEAANYRRMQPGFFGRLWRRRANEGLPGDARPSGLGPKASAEAKTTRIAASPVVESAKPTRAGPLTGIEAATARVAGLLAGQPQNYVAQKRVLAELERIEGFTRSGSGAFFGLGSYKDLMKDLGRRDARITVVDQAGGGTGIVFLPPANDVIRSKGKAAPSRASSPSAENMPAAAAVVGVGVPAADMARTVAATDEVDPIRVGEDRDASPPETKADRPDHGAVAPLPDAQDAGLTSPSGVDCEDPAPTVPSTHTERVEMAAHGAMT